MRAQSERSEPGSKSGSGSEAESPLEGRVEEFVPGVLSRRRARRPGRGIAPRRIDITETDADYRVRAELPEISQDELTVEIEGGMLCIRGEAREHHDEVSGASRRIGSAHRSFSRSFCLPRSADPDRISTEYRDGILDVTVTKRAPIRP